MSLPTHCQIYLDGVTLDSPASLVQSVKGFTTNPKQLASAGVRSYTEYAKGLLLMIGQDRPISFEVLSTESDHTIREQAHLIADWGPNVVVKVPIVAAYSARPLSRVIAQLRSDGIPINATAICEKSQIASAVDALDGSGYISIFAGRIGDTGIDPAPLFRYAGSLTATTQIKRIWASARQIYDFVVASREQCEVITLTKAMCDKIPCLGRSLASMSHDTVAEFEDAVRNSGLAL